MELEEKMAYFETEVAKDIHSEIQEQLDQYEATLKSDLEDFKKNVERNFATRLQGEKENIRKANNKELSRVQISQQHELYIKEQQLKKALFKRFKEEIEKYKSTSDYIDQLTQMMAHFKDFAKEETYDVYIDPSDEKLIATLEEHTKHDIIVSNRHFLGGLRCVLRERDVLLDYSFSTLLEHVEDEFTIEGAH